MQETELRNDKGKVIAMGTRDQIFRMVKHDKADGIYNVVGPGIDLVVERKAGVVYPTSGHVDEQRFPTRTIGEAKEVLEDVK